MDSNNYVETEEIVTPAQSEIFLQKKEIVVPSLEPLTMVVNDEIVVPPNPSQSRTLFTPLATNGLHSSNILVSSNLGETLVSSRDISTPNHFELEEESRPIRRTGRMTLIKSIKITDIFKINNSESIERSILSEQQCPRKRKYSQCS